jgi:hypothetical protein
MDTTLRIQQNTPWEETDLLIRVLRCWGIKYLVGDTTLHIDDDKQQLTTVDLVKRLARCSYPRVRDATISLFLLHPELAPAAIETLQSGVTEETQQITTLILATLYLQRLWSIQLALALGHPAKFPEHPFTSLWQDRYLPAPAYHDGKWGLQALQAVEQRRSGLPLNYLGDWQNQIDHLLLQEGFHFHTASIPLSLLENSYKSEPEIDMSMRPNVDKEQIENFLQNLGRIFHKPGRLYLVGGAALVHAGLRPGSTQDIDLEIHASDEDELTNAIRQLKDKMKVNVEFASPSDFIPIPRQWEMNAKYIGRYGTIDIFYFDFYSIALSKIQRGNTRDIHDVKLLLQHGLITLDGLDAAYGEVLPQVGKRPYHRLDPQLFVSRYDAVRQVL